MFYGALPVPLSLMTMAAGNPWSLQVQEDQVRLRVSVPRRTPEQRLEIQATRTRVSVSVAGNKDRPPTDIILPNHVRIEPQSADVFYKSRTGTLWLHFRRAASVGPAKRAAPNETSQETAGRCERSAPASQQSLANTVEQTPESRKANPKTLSESLVTLHTAAEDTGPESQSAGSTKDETCHSSCEVPKPKRTRLGSSTPKPAVEGAQAGSAASPWPATPAHEPSNQQDFAELAANFPPLTKNTSELASSVDTSSDVASHGSSELVPGLADFLEHASHPQILRALRQVRRLYLSRTADPGALWRRIATARNNATYARTLLREMMHAVVLQGTGQEIRRKQRLAALIKRAKSGVVKDESHQRADRKWVDKHTEQTVAHRVASMLEQRISDAREKEFAHAAALAAKAQERKTRKLQKLAWQTALARRSLESRRRSEARENTGRCPAPITQRAGKSRARVSFLLDGKQVHFPA